MLGVWAHCLCAYIFSFAMFKVHGGRVVNCMMDMWAVGHESGNAWPLQCEQLCIPCVVLSKQCCAKHVGFELDMPNWATHADEAMQSI